MDKVEDGEYYIKRLGRYYKIVVLDGLVVNATCSLYRSDHMDYFLSYNAESIAKFINDESGDEVKKIYLEDKLLGLSADLACEEMKYRIGMDRLVRNVVRVKSDISEVRKLLGDMNV